MAFPAKYRGFTLLELLICIAILAILAALILSCLSTVRESSRRTGCRSVLRQYGAGVFMYADANRDYFPTYRGGGLSGSLRTELRVFWRLLEPHVAVSGARYHDNYAPPRHDQASEGIPAAMICPAARLSGEAGAVALKRGDIYEARMIRGGSYHTAMIDVISHPAAVGRSAAGRRLGSILNASIYFFMEDAGFNDGTDDRQYPFWRLRDFLNGFHPWGHGRYFNLGYLDGHAAGFNRKRRELGWEWVFSREFSGAAD